MSGGYQPKPGNGGTRTPPHQGGSGSLPTSKPGVVGNTEPLLLLEPATNWTGQTYADRFRASATALYVHGYITRHEFNRIVDQIFDDAAQARLQRMKGTANG